MKRRDFITLLGGAAGWPRVARGQQSAMRVIGFLHGGSSDPQSSYWPAVIAFRQSLADAGFVESRNLTIEYRWAEERFDQLPMLASDLVWQNVALIFVGGGDVAALAAKRATETIPIVFAIGADPVRQGLVPSMSRPSGNLTGVTFLSVELNPKMLELLRELVPHAVTIAVLGNPIRANFELLLHDVLEPARAMGLRVHVVKARDEQEIDVAFSAFDQVQVDALLVLSDPLYFSRRDQISKRALSRMLPMIVPTRSAVVSGGLASYGASVQDGYSHAGAYCGRILKGEKPADLPIMQPTKFELVINLKTAKALGLTLPLSLLARADEVIE